MTYVCTFGYMFALSAALRRDWIYSRVSACVIVLGFYLVISAYYYQFHCKIIIIFSADILIQCDCMCIHFFGHGVGDHLGIYVYCLCPLAL